MAHDQNDHALLTKRYYILGEKRKPLEDDESTSSSETVGKKLSAATIKLPECTTAIREHWSFLLRHFLKKKNLQYLEDFSLTKKRFGGKQVRSAVQT